MLNWALPSMCLEDDTMGPLVECDDRRGGIPTIQLLMQKIEVQDFLAISSRPYLTFGSFPNLEAA
jgi:hypothetical protein